MKLPKKLLVFLLFLPLIGFGFYHLYNNKNPQYPINERHITEAVIDQIEQLGKLELVRYHLKDVVEYSRTNPFPMPDDKILLVFGGDAVGCLDLQKINKQNITQQGDSLIITLPQPELCYTKLSHQDSKVYDVSITKFFDKTSLTEEAFKRAEKQLETVAIQSGILDQTRQNAITMLKPLLENLTKKKVFLTFETKNPAPILMK